MKRHATYLLLFCLPVMLFCSCEKNITIDLPQPPDYVVVEGQIETGGFPFVILTKNSSYYSAFDIKEIDKYFVRGARVRVTDGTDTVSLQEFSIDTLGVTVSVYSSLAMKGEEGKAYTLLVDAAGRHLSAITTIPTSYPLDSIWYAPGPDPERPDLVRLMCRYTDPPSLGQYVRYFTRQNSQPFYPGANSVFDDIIVNGTTFDFVLDRGINRNAEDAYKDYGFFYHGDTITVKWCNIDRPNFDFWRTLEFELGNQGNPFSTPTHVLSNVNGGLGTWGGYAANYKTIIVPK